MAKNISSRSTRQIQGGLAAAVRTLKDELAVVPARFAPYSPEELYQRFLVVMPDHKGNLSSTCGEYGRALSIDASFDFGGLILPGIASLDVTVGATGEVLSVALLIIHRSAPKVLAGPSAAVPRRWDGSKPVCFLSMSGQKKALSLTLGANFKIGNNLAADIDADGGGILDSAGLVLDLSVQLAAGVELNGIIMHLTDPAPGWYITGNDAGLKSDFNTILGPGTNKSFKQEVVQWYEYMLDFVAQQLSIDKATKPALAGSLQAVEAKLKELNGGLGLEEQLQGLAKDFATDQIKNLIGEVVNDKTALSALSQVIAYANSKLDNTRTKELIANLKNLVLLYEIYALSSSAARVYLQQVKDQIAWYNNSLTVTKAAKDASGNIVLPPKIGSRPGLKNAYQRLSYLSVFSFIPSAKGSADANAQATISAEGNISGEKVGANASAKAGAKLTVSGQLGFTTYRYQTFALSDNGIPLVSTQDTQLSYRQAKIDANMLGALKASAEFSDYGLSEGFLKEISTSNVAHYNMLTYHSVQAYWQYGASLSSGTSGFTSQTVALESGSGISFGCSVSFLKLVRIARQLAGTEVVQQKDQNLLASLAKQLRVKLADLKTFITAAAFEEDGSSELSAYTGVILESSHAFNLSAEPTLPVKKRSNSFFNKNPSEVQYYLPDLLEQDLVNKAMEAIKNPPEIPTASTPSLAAIRLRVRLADHSANEKTLFQLGFKVAAGLNVALNKIESVGNESVLDVYTHWFGPYTAYNQSNQTDAYEQSVPAVALLHQ